MQELEFKSQADETACKAEPAALEDEIYAGVAAKGQTEEDKKSSKSAGGQPARETTMVLQEPQYQGSFWRHLLTFDLWLFWLTFFGLWGTGTVINMNAAQLYRSINNGVYDPRRQSLYVALIGLGSAIGRIVSGVIDMKLTRWRRDGVRDISTTLFLPTGCLFLFIAYLVFTVIPPEGLVFPFLIGSIGTGMGWALGALSVRICYARDVGKHYNFMFSSGFVSVIVLNRFMFGGMFDAEGERLNSLPYCNQRSCVRNQCFILMSINVLSFFSGCVVHWRFARFVKREKKCGWSNKCPFRSMKRFKPSKDIQVICKTNVYN
ncbi:hypothetical protein AGDE_10877 [Angomonas deanei]|uniref:Uncharacterized protein n=1 Tax=Angomonas deanei TaxID=59799 RepID=A0A7G2CHY5_9TRYP|nr:hypothetical protein AGDE_10877 [Angomonas deanei]CAD2218534.1 hypothetical protein, conserved [Angomonas deanei]|eukprot:EPY27215.1 hypothetical protein AGDE_10877 [Angomonas deanei]